MKATNHMPSFFGMIDRLEQRPFVSDTTTEWELRPAGTAEFTWPSDVDIAPNASPAQTTPRNGLT